MIRKAVKVLASVALLSTLSMAQKEALIVGVSNYAGVKNDFGQGIEIDINNMKTLFEKWDFHVTVLFNHESMKLEQLLRSYAQQLKGSDKFIFYYSGHGSHTPDKNGDELDGEDESIVLSDGRENYYFLDDALNGYMNMIKARKLVLFDSCHSGSAFKAFGKKLMSKSLPEKTKAKILKTKAFKRQESKLKDGDYIVFSASQDNEISLATGSGSLFTNAFYQQLNTEKGLNTKLDEINRRVGYYIKKYCKASEADVHHPQLSTSNLRLKFATINKFLEPAKVEPTPPVEKDIAVMPIPQKETFHSGELLDFKIDTLGNSGYLTIFSIEEGKPFLMYQSSKPQKGVFNFKDFNIQPPIECYKSCGKNCASEKSVVYVAFSAKPITIRFNQNSKSIETNPSKKFKAFRHQNEASFKTIIKKFETTVK